MPEREITTVAGENAGVRAIDAENPEDFRRASALQRRQQENYFIKEELTDEELRSWIAESSNTKDWLDGKVDYLLFGVAGGDGVKEQHQEEVEELQGWNYINFVTGDELNEIKELQREGIVPESPDDQPPIEMQYIKLENAVGGQMGSAARQICGMIGKFDAYYQRMKSIKEVKEELEYTDEQILAKASNEGESTEGKFWQKVNESYWSKPNKPTQLVVATINPKNNISQRMAESIGFVHKGEVTSVLHQGEQDMLYILDWDILNAKLQQKSLDSLIGKKEGDTREIVKNSQEDATDIVS